jgi:HlyD family secretion protein
MSDIGSLLASSIPSSSVSQTTIDTYKTSVATARTSLNTASSALTTAYKAETAAQTALVTAERDLALAQAGATQEDVRAQEASVKAAEADVLSALSQLGKTQIRAPFAGTVTKIDAKIGKNAQPTEPQVSVIGSGAFQVETFVPELNVALVKVGDPAAVTFDSYGDAQFAASVLTVDLGETVKDGVSTYRTVLVFIDTDERIRSGMTANVLITTMRKADTIAIPQKLVIQKNGVPVVKVLVDKEVVERTITTGAVSSTGDIEVVSGLSAGDQVILE